MTYITARFGVPVAKPRPRRKAQAAHRGATGKRMDGPRCQRGQGGPAIVQGERKQVSGQLVERVFGELSDTPQSAMKIADIVGVSYPSSCCALRILWREGRAAYTVEPSGVGRVRMWVRT